MAENGTLVDSGSFRVDRKQALDKLMRFQLFDPRMYLLPWVQAAVAGGAGRIRVRVQPAAIELCFDGRPWEQAELKDPYRFLFEEDPAGVYGRNRDLAIGILSALRLRPSAMDVAFSDGRAEHSLRIQDITRETLSSGPSERLAAARNDGGANVRMSVLVGWAFPVSFAKELENLDRFCRYCPVPIEAPDGALLGHSDHFARPSRLQPRRAFSEDGISGELSLTYETLLKTSLDFVTNGVTVSTEELMLPAVQALGYVRNDSLRKSISQAGIIKEENYKKSVALLHKEAEKLLLGALDEAQELSAPTGQALGEQRFRWHWMSWEAHSIAETMLYRLLDPLSEDAEGGPDLPATQDKADAVHKMSLIVAAARASCLTLKIDMLKKEGAVCNALWDAPLLFDTACRPLTLRQMEEQRLWLGYVPYSEHDPGPGGEKLSIALVIREADRRFLEEFYGTDARPLRSSSLQEAPRIAPVLEEPNLLVKVPFKMWSAVGEVGLSLTPHTRSSRIRWLREGRPLSISAWPMGGLRMEVVADSLALRAAPRPGAVDQPTAQCLSAIVSAAPEAYRRISKSYDPSSNAPRQAIIREHLLDLAVISWDGAREAWITNEWLEDLALFRDTSSRMLSMRDLRSAAAKGERIMLRPSTHPDSLLEMTEGYPDHVKALFASSKLVAGIAPRPQSAPKQETAVPKRPAERAKAPAPSPGAPPPPQQPAPVDLVIEAGVASAADDGAVPTRLLRQWLKGLALRKSCPLSKEEIDSIGFTEQEGRGLLLKASDALFVNLAHPMARMLSDLGGLETNLPYLISTIYTALNRANAKLTDEDDMKLQMALAEYLLQAPEQGENHGKETA